VGGLYKQSSFSEPSDRLETPSTLF
ncbi:ORFL268C, partial [Human betaherpesvirus 5]